MSTKYILHGGNAQHISQFEDAKGDRKLEYQLAKTADFDNQINWADVVYLCGSSGGGATERLFKVLSKVDDLRKKFDGKTIAGESAGANCLAKYCYSRSSGVIEGLGLVPVKLIAHYELGDEAAIAEMPINIDCLYLRSYEYAKMNI